jgi:uncharacterized protein
VVTAGVRKGARHTRSAVAAALMTASLAGVPAAFAVGAPIPGPPAHFVTDTAGFLSSTTRDELDRRLEAFDKSSGHQVLLWIGRTTGETPIEDWGVRAFAAWRVGRKGLDDGIVLFIMADDRKVRIEVGYGMEDRIPDARAASIIRERIVPRLRQGDRDGAARAGIDAILTATGGPAGAVPQRPPALAARGWGQLALFLLLGIVALGFLGTHPGLAVLLLTNLASSRGTNRGSGTFRGPGGGFGGFGGGGFSGGGFSGGGGRSGGGGATGSW